MPIPYRICPYTPAIRLGGKRRKAGGTPRPLKVCFKKKSSKMAILRKAFQLQFNPDFKILGIGPDESEAEIAYYSNLRNELAERRAAGEKDIKLRQEKL